METPTIVETPRSLHPENEHSFGKVGVRAIAEARLQAAWRSFDNLGFDAYRTWILESPAIRPVMCYEV